MGKMPPINNVTQLSDRFNYPVELLEAPERNFGCALQSILFLGRANGSLPSSVLLHALSFRTAVALQHILVHQDSHFMPSPVGHQETSPLRHLVLALQPGMIPPVRDLLLDPGLAHRVDTLQHLRVARFSPPINLSLHGLENVALRCSETLQHLDIDLKGPSSDTFFFSMSDFI
jgi:hypothetical protein